MGRAATQPDADALHIRFRAKVDTYVDGALRGDSPLSSVTVCNNDGATYQKVPIGRDGVFVVDFKLAPRPAKFLQAGLTDRLQFHFHSAGDVCHNGNPEFEFHVASGSVYIGDILLRSCEANGAEIPELSAPVQAKLRLRKAAVTDPGATAVMSAPNGFVFGHNFTENEVHMRLLPLDATVLGRRHRLGGPADAPPGGPADAGPAPETPAPPGPPDAPSDAVAAREMLQWFDAMVLAGKIRDSVLWKSEEMNARVEVTARVEPAPEPRS